MFRYAVAEVLHGMVEPDAELWLYFETANDAEEAVVDLIRETGRDFVVGRNRRARQSSCRH